MNKLAYFLLVSISLIIIAFAKPAKADYGQYGQYGGTPSTYNILIDKMVSKPTNETKGGLVDYEYVDNLSASDPRFNPGQIIVFKLRVKNTSNAALISVNVKDYVPSYLDPIEGPGTYDSNTRVISFNAGDFEADQEKTFYIKMKVLPKENLPTDKSLICLVNKAEASNERSSDDDTAQFCIEKSGQQVLSSVTIPSSMPAAGPEMGAFLMAGELLALGIGFSLKRKTS